MYAFAPVFLIDLRCALLLLTKKIIPKVSRSLALSLSRLLLYCFAYFDSYRVGKIFFAIEIYSCTANGKCAFFLGFEVKSVRTLIAASAINNGLANRLHGTTDDFEINQFGQG